jgi:hypothetical protein
LKSTPLDLIWFWIPPFQRMFRWNQITNSTGMSRSLMQTQPCDLPNAPSQSCRWATGKQVSRRQMNFGACVVNVSDGRQTCSRSDRAQTCRGFRTTETDERSLADPREGHFLLWQCQVHCFSIVVLLIFAQRSPLFRPARWPSRLTKQMSLPNVGIQRPLDAPCIHFPACWCVHLGQSNGRDQGQDQS